jgi:hypothetical protein
MIKIELEAGEQHLMPTLQHVSATAQGENVEMILYALVAGCKTPVYVRMGEAVATDLAVLLTRAAIAARIARDKR